MLVIKKYSYKHKNRTIHDAAEVEVDVESVSFCPGTVILLRLDGPNMLTAVTVTL